MYVVSINGQRINGTAADILQYLRAQAFFFEGTAEEYLEWLASNVRKLHHIFINTKPDRPLEEREKSVVEQLINHGLVEMAG